MMDKEADASNVVTAASMDPATRKHFAPALFATSWCFALFVESSDPLCPCLCGGGPSSHARGDSSCGYGCHQPSQADDVIGPCGKSSMSRGTPRLCPWLELTGPGSVWAADMLSPFDVAGLCGLHSGIVHVAACVPSRGGSATESLG